MEIEPEVAFPTQINVHDNMFRLQYAYTACLVYTFIGMFCMGWGEWYV